MANIKVAIELDIDTQTYVMSVDNVSAHCAVCGAREVAGMLAQCYNDVATDVNTMILTGTAGKPN